MAASGQEGNGKFQKRLRNAHGREVQRKATSKSALSDARADANVQERARTLRVDEKQGRRCWSVSDVA